MGQALYRKYRSHSLSEVVGQAHITDTLARAIKNGKISHAYLFTGPRGVGKTSVARILAHEINNLPYKDDSVYLDIIEIDAASNRRIDEIRDLREKVNIAPTSAKYKVYIIDEVHMLTREAFNALLKTLEEPPAHAVFILATTEVQKLPDTIISRTQRHSFRPIAASKVVEHLRTIADKEKIKIDDDALALIAAHGEGSFRDSISLLDQASSYGEHIDRKMVLDMLGLAPAEQIQTLINALQAQNAPKVIELLNKAAEQGQNAAQLASQLERALRDKIITKELTGATWFSLARQLLTVASSHEPDRYLEIILLEFALANTSSQPVMSTPEIDKKPSENKPTTKIEQATKPPKAPTNTPKIPLDASAWEQVLQVLKKQYSTLYAVVRMARPEISDEGIMLFCKFAFHQKRIEDAKNQKIIADIVKNLTDRDVAIDCQLEVKSASEQQVETPLSTATDDGFSTISNIFGGGELL